MELTVAERLRDEIARRGLTVTEAAHRLGVARPTLSIVLNGRGRLSPELALAFEREFGLVARQRLVDQLDEELTRLRKNRKSKP